LNSEFLLQYKNTLEVADSAIVYFSNKTIVSKKLEPLNIEDVRLSFNNLKLEVFDNPLDLNKYLNSLNYNNSVLLMMSSGNFGNFNFEKLKEIIKL
jgi:UDP-N-acetylmuramate: L-alanyl-gamma-D-glutamyl-meso-diaminopimelate ligase